MIVKNRTASTSARKRPAAPTLALRSDFDLPVYMSDIVIIGNAHFVRFGSLVVRLGHATLLDIKAGDAALAQRLTIQTRGRRWSQNDELELFMWSSQGEATVTVIVAQSPEPIEPGAVPLPMDAEQLNRLVATDAAEGRKNSAREYLDWLAGLDVGDAPPAAYKELLMCGFGLHNQESLAGALEAEGGVYAEAAKRLRALDETIPIPSYDGTALFPNKFYFNESHARLIDMEGNKNILVTLSAPQTPAIGLAGGGAHVPARGSFGLFQNVTGLEYSRATAREVFDRMAALSPPARLDAPPAREVTGRWIYDLVLPAGRAANVTLPVRPSLAAAPVGHPNPNYFGYWYFTTTYRRNRPQVHPTANFYYPPAVAFSCMIEAADDITFTSPQVVHPLRAMDAIGADISLPNVTRRFLRVTLRASITWTPRTTGDAPGFDLSPFRRVNWSLSTWRSPSTGLAVADANVTGGTGAIKMEVPNALGAWQEFIPSIAIARGDQVTQQFGQANSSYILPSGPRALRARLDVTGALETSAAITLVS